MIDFNSMYSQRAIFFVLDRNIAGAVQQFTLPDSETFVEYAPPSGPYFRQPIPVARIRAKSRSKSSG
jgi:hypothetical protein